MKKDTCANGNQKIWEVAILTSNTIDFQSKSVQDKKVIRERSIHQTDIITINIYVPNIRAPKCLK